MTEIYRVAYTMRAKFILLIHEWKANPRRIVFYELNSAANTSNDPNSLYKKIFSLTVTGVKLARETGVYSGVRNPRSIWVSVENCSSELCFSSSEIFLKIYRYYVKKDADVLLEFRDEGRFVSVKIMDRSGLLCGPLIKIVKVDVF